ncbi:melanophilin isoform X3 [Oryzias latipes]|uniref:melanophilin isoform X3 n=1 Tax=Oryzias latipes TaxID=8090 RepID=UPI0002A4AF16|nr:melanophilin isoform X3 [Oryzias latipes]
MERKLDLSRLTDEEAKHVWEVIQRDFNLRKKEEERLGELKNQIEKEDTKRELLGSQSRVSDSLCIRCLQPFKFLVNSKRQCLDCCMYTCKSCSRYNKKERGWVCDNCRMTRVLKIGTLGWYHDNVRNRFKRFGSAKVMRSLYKRLNGEGVRDDDTQSMPDVRSHVCNGNEEDGGEGEAQRYKMMRKNKRLLSVHPMDFDSEEYFLHSRRPSMQQMQEDRYYRNDVDYDNYNQRANRRRSLDRHAMRADDHAENRMVRARSLSKISSSVARQQYVDTSDEEEYQRYPLMYQQPPHRRRNSRTTSQENLGQAPPINELNKRMSAIESLLSRLEEKMTPADEAASAKNEEEKLRRKLSELAGNLSDKGLSSDEEPGKKFSLALKGHSSSRSGPVAPLVALKDKELSSSSDEMPTETQKVYVTAGQSYDLESKLQRLEKSAKNRFGGTTDSDLSELEDVVALTAARVQSAESEVSDIESKLAALSASGPRKKVSGSHMKKRAGPDLKTNGAHWRSNMV